MAGPAPELHELLADARWELPVPFSRPHPGDRSRKFCRGRGPSDRAGGRGGRTKKNETETENEGILAGSQSI